MADNKSLPISVISTTIPIIKDVIAVIDEHQKNNQIENRLLNSFKIETDSISATYASFSSISETQLFPLLKTIHVAPTRSQLNGVVKCTILLYKNYVTLLSSFRGLANKCKQVSLNTGFMSQVKDYDAELFDFINRLAETITKDRVEFNDGFYGFIQLYGNDPFKKFKKSEMDNIVKEMEPMLGLVKNIIKPSLTRESIDRENRKEFLKVCKELVKELKIFKVKYTKLVEIRNYVPEKLRPLMLLFEENYPIESEIKKPKEFPKKR
jgi:hypothetical protein